MTRPEPGDPNNGLLEAYCWCEQAIVAATTQQVRDGVHLSCGRNPNTRRGRPPKTKPGQPCD